MPHVVLVTSKFFLENRGIHTELLEEHGCVVKGRNGYRPLSSPELAGLVGDVEALIAGGDEIDAVVIAAAPCLRVISRLGVGYDRVDLQAATRAGVVVTTTPGTNHKAVAELALGLMIALARHLPVMVERGRAGDWTRQPGMELAGKTLGILGLGQIGQALAVRARALEMDVLAFDPVEDARLAARHGVHYLPLPEVLRRSDFLSLHLPATPGAAPLLGQAELRAMKRGAFLINTARGSLADEAALYAALVDGHLAGAALDVFAQEPPTAGPLLALPNVLPTPHIGASTVESGRRSALLATENVLQVLRGERCPNAVNPEVYDPSLA